MDTKTRSLLKADAALLVWTKTSKDVPYVGRVTSYRGGVLTLIPNSWGPLINITDTNIVHVAKTSAVFKTTVKQ